MQNELTRESRLDRLRFLRERMGRLNRMGGLLLLGSDSLFDMADELRELDRQHGEPILEISQWSEGASGFFNRPLHWGPSDLRIRHVTDFLIAVIRTQVEIGTIVSTMDETTDALNDSQKPYRFGPQYRSVRWYEETYSFSDAQAKVVEILADAYEMQTPDVDATFLLQDKDTNSTASAARRLKELFRDGPGKRAWGTMIVPGESRGTYRLKEPESAKW